MKNINLVPKVPRIQQIFMPALIASSLFSLSIAGALMVYYSHLGSGLTELQAKSSSLNASVKVLIQKRTVDPQTNDYNLLSADVQKLKENRRYWLPVMELITSQLPEVARVTSVDSGDAQSNAPSTQAAQTQGNQSSNLPTAAVSRIKISGEFAELTQIAEYIIRLQRSPLVDNISITNVQRMEIALASSASATSGTASIIPNSLLAGSGYAEGDYLRSLESSMKPAESQGDELLNQLRWMVTQQMVGQQFGIQVPDKPITTPGTGSKKSNAVPGSALTEEDFGQARAKVEQFKKQSPANNNNPSALNNKEEPKLPSVRKYSVTFELTLKKQANEK